MDPSTTQEHKCATYSPPLTKPDRSIALEVLDDALVETLSNMREAMEERAKAEHELAAKVDEQLEYQRSAREIRDAIEQLGGDASSRMERHAKALAELVADGGKGLGHSPPAYAAALKRIAAET